MKDTIHSAHCEILPFTIVLKERQHQKRHGSFI